MKNDYSYNFFATSSSSFVHNVLFQAEKFMIEHSIVYFSSSCKAD